MPEPSINCPICRVPLRVDTTVCSGCDEDLAVLVHVQSQRTLLYNKGLELAKAGDLQSAILTLQAAERVGEGSVAATTLLGKAYAQSGQYGDARVTWERALLVEPDNSVAASGLAALNALERANAENLRRRTVLQADARRRAGREDRGRLFVSLAGVFLIGATGSLLLQRLGRAR